MKKMNLNFLWLKGKMVLPLFLLVGLFMFSATSVSAQYVSESQAAKLIDKHISELPQRTASLRRADQAMTPKMVQESVNELRHSFGQLILHGLHSGRSVEDAIAETNKVAMQRIPAGTPGIEGYITTVKQEYIDLLKEN